MMTAEFPLPQQPHGHTVSRRGTHYLDPLTWAQRAPVRAGSWWPQWQQWLAQHSGAQQSPPAMGNAEAGYPAIDEAPGPYVFQR